MFQQIQMYIIGALALLLVSVSGGFYLYQKTSSAERDALKAANLTYVSTIKDQNRTIEQIVKDGEKLAAANKKLVNRIVTSEMEHSKEWESINALDLASKANSEPSDEFEKEINSVFEKSIENLRGVSGN